jgi:hypothetical protein
LSIGLKGPLLLIRPLDRAQIFSISCFPRGRYGMATG